MNKRSVTLNIILILITILSLSCKKDNATEPSKNSHPDYLVGIWKLTYIDIPDRYSGDPANMGWHISITLAANGDYTETGVLWNGEYTLTGSWSASNTEIMVHSNGLSYYAAYGRQGDQYTFTITVPNGNMQDLYIFHRQD